MFSFVKYNCDDSMKTLLFKTNLNCSNCIRSLTPFLNSEMEIEHWSVDADHPDRLLIVEGDVTVQRIQALVAEAGFWCEPLDHP